MKRIILYLILVLTMQTFSFADVTKLPDDVQKVLCKVSRFREIHAAANLPPAVFALCADSSGRLAEPGQKWEISDSITDETLPRKRLIWAVTDGDYYVVHYERGGYGLSFHVLVIKLKDGDSKPSFIWRGGGEQLKDYSAFLDAVANDKLDDALD